MLCKASLFEYYQYSFECRWFIGLYFDFAWPVFGRMVFGESVRSDHRPRRNDFEISPLWLPAGLPLTWFIVVGGVVALPLLVLMPDYSYRYGLQWLGFYFSCGGCSALVFAQSGLRRDYLQFLRDRFPSEVVALLLLMIVGSVCANGFVPQATAVLTMLMVMGTYPLLCFLWFIQREHCDHFHLLIRIVLGVVLAESLFLSSYQWLGLGLSSSDSLSIWPRIFLNVRDNNQWLACGFWIPISLWFSAHVPEPFILPLPRFAPLSVIGLMSMFWYLDLLTYGRGAFLAMLFSSLCASVWSTQSLGRTITVRFVRDQLIAIVLALMSVFALRSSLPFSNMVSRLAVDVGRTQSGRWQILLHWIDGWLNTSVFWGQGWGVIPDNVAWAPWSKDPHNVYVQILADGGIWGVGFFVLAFIVLFRSVKNHSFTLPSLAFASGLFVYQGVDRIWAISSGIVVVILNASFLFSFVNKRPFIELSLHERFVRRISSTALFSLSTCSTVLLIILIAFSDGRP